MARGGEGSRNDFAAGKNLFPKRGEQHAHSFSSIRKARLRYGGGSNAKDTGRKDLQRNSKTFGKKKKKAIWGLVSPPFQGGKML